MKCSRRGFAMLSGALATCGLETLTGCGDGSTGGRRVALGARVAPESLTFVNASGFEIELQRALLSIGPLRYVEGMPVARRNPLERALGVRVAHAHPGHYTEGGVLGEMVVPTSVDLAQGPVTLTAAPGITGFALSGRFEFRSPAEGPFAAELGADVVAIEGVATLEGESRSFRARAALADVLDAEGAPAVAGCEFANGLIERDGVVTLWVRPAVWLDQVDFALLPQNEDDEPALLAPGDTPHKAFVRGLKKAAAYHFEYSPGQANRKEESR